MPSSTASIDAKVILLDIEGTTTSISFVKDELFPYVLNNMESYLTSHWGESQTTSDIEALRKQVADDETNNIPSVPPVVSSEHTQAEIINSVITNVKWQMSSDRKTTALKQLQGHMWLNAYEKKEVEGHLFEDVSICMKKWKKLGKSICIYSSGSVAAQKLLFTYSIDGDLTELITDYFDTKVGGKREAKSYAEISERLSVNSCDVVFLTDIIEEARAAKKAGMQSLILRRPGNAELADTELAEFKTLNNFHELKLK